MAAERGGGPVAFKSFSRIEVVTAAAVATDVRVVRLAGDAGAEGRTRGIL